MGEIAEMMLDGTLCEGCGEYIGKSEGYPQYCSLDCAHDRGFDIENHENETEGCELGENIDNAIIWLEILKEKLLVLKRRKKAKAMSGVIKNLEIFKKSL
jgi:hypothetical protein